MSEWDGVTLEEINRQRTLGWPDFHPEDYCHRCGRPNTRSWFATRALWEEAGIDGRWNEIICPSCFTELWEESTGQRGTFEVRLHHSGFPGEPLSKPAILASEDR